VAGHPLRPATRRCLGGPLPRQLADRPRAPRSAPEFSSNNHAVTRAYAVLPGRWAGYPPLIGRSLTCYAPVRQSPIAGCLRLACVKHAASVRPEPGSNSPLVEKVQTGSSNTAATLPRMAARPNHLEMFSQTLPDDLNSHRINESASHILRSQLQLSNSSLKTAAFHDSLEYYCAPPRLSTPCSRLTSRTDQKRTLRLTLRRDHTCPSQRDRRIEILPNPPRACKRSHPQPPLTRPRPPSAKPQHLPGYTSCYKGNSTRDSSGARAR
jgi:hypothetical protein